MRRTDKVTWSSFEKEHTPRAHFEKANL